MDRQRLEDLRALEDIEAPSGRRGRQARFRRFVVFEHDGRVGHGVRFRGEFPRGGVVRFLLLNLSGRFYDGAVVGGRVLVKGGLLRGERGLRALPGWGRSGRAAARGRRRVPSLGAMIGVPAAVSRVVFWRRRARGAVITL